MTTFLLDNGNVHMPLTDLAAPMQLAISKWLGVVYSPAGTLCGRYGLDGVIVDVPAPAPVCAPVCAPTTVRVTASAPRFLTAETLLEAEVFMKLYATFGFPVRTFRTGARGAARFVMERYAEGVKPTDDWRFVPAVCREPLRRITLDLTFEDRRSLEESLVGEKAAFAHLVAALADSCYYGAPNAAMRFAARVCEWRLIPAPGLMTQARAVELGLY